MAIAVPDELQELESLGTNRALTAVCGSSEFFMKIIARADMPWRPVERRLPCQMNCRKVWDQALRAVRGRPVAGR